MMSWFFRVRKNSSNPVVLVMCVIVLSLSVYCFIIIINYHTLFDDSRKVEENASSGLSNIINLKEQKPNWNERMRTNILFLKTHKTGSSTLQNILLRFGLRHTLDVMLPDRGNYLAYVEPLNSRTLSYSSTPLSGKFNIFACHSRYHQNTLKFMYDNTIRVTLLRNIPRYFESVYNFFGLRRKYHLTFDQLLQSLPNTSIDFTRHRVTQRSTNQLCHDLGLWSGSNPNDTIINDFIKFIDENFEFVMITEFFDECLVLLADIMKWPLEYVAYLPLMARTETKKSAITRVDEVNLRKLNPADTALYEFFLAKLRRRIIQYGEDRLAKDLQTLRKLKNDLYTKCIAGKNRSGFGGTVSYDLKTNTDWECTHASKGELAFIEEIRRKQRERFAQDRKLMNLMSTYEWNL